MMYYISMAQCTTAVSPMEIWQSFTKPSICEDIEYQGCVVGGANRSSRFLTVAYHDAVNAWVSRLLCNEILLGDQIKR